MRVTGLLTFLLLQATAPAQTRSVAVAVTDEKGAPVRGLTREEVVVLENGVARDLVRIDPDDRPLTLAVLLDTSQAMGSSYRLHVVEAVTRFLTRAPEGARFAVWTTGDRPTRVVDYTDDAAAVAKALRRVAPQGGNTVLDALVEASRDLGKQEGRRTAVLVVTGLGVEFSNRDKHRVVDEAAGNADVFHAVQVEEGEARFEDRQRYEFALAGLARRTGGLHESLLSSMGVDAALTKVAADLASRYRLSYASLPEVTKAKVEVRVARPGVRVRVARGEDR
ncbi:MAG: VWA domain-containing protein [Acidobacteria bacterium]|nr:VWA domain-containing protein [Acidobacteriota bacterium]